jgi:hypothetical protein
MSSIDQQFVEFVVKSLVSKPDAVKIERRIDEKGVLLELTVDPEDLGRVIGKRGATAQSLRTLLRALGTKNDARYNLKIMDNGVFPHRTDDTATAYAPSNDDNVSSDSDVSEPASTSAPAPAPEPTNDDNEENTQESQEERPSHSEDMVNRTRKELEDLDDLDV